MQKLRFGCYRMLPWRIIIITIYFFFSEEFFGFFPVPLNIFIYV